METISSLKRIKCPESPSPKKKLVYEEVEQVDHEQYIDKKD